MIKTAVQGTINAGEDAVFDITVTNTGTGTATGVSLSDPLPSGVSGDWVVSGADAGDCVSPIAASTLECEFGNLTAGESRTVTVTAPTDFENCTVLDNTATASSTNAPNDSDNASITCDKPNLSVDKTPDAQSINAGENVVFDVTRQQRRTGNRQGSHPDRHPARPDRRKLERLRALIQATASARSSVARSTAPSVTSSPVHSKTVTVTAATDYDNCATYDNTATADASNAPEASDDGQVTCQKPDLSIEKTGNGTVNAGEDVVFDITVSNGGPGTATSVSLNDLLPQGTAGPWAITTQPGGDPCSIAGPSLSCDFGDLGSGQSRTVTVEAPTDYENCTTYDNTANASSTNAAEAEDSASVSCDRPGLGTLKTAVQGTISAGDVARFSIEVSNIGQGVARSVTLNDPLPGPVTGNWTIDSQPNGNPCSIADGTLSCEFGDLGPGESIEPCRLCADRLRELRRLDNTAVASACELTQCTRIRQHQLPEVRSLSVKTGNGTISAGENVIFEITVTNAGPGTARQ